MSSSELVPVLPNPLLSGVGNVGPAMPELVPPLRTQVRESPAAITAAESQRAVLPRVNIFVVTASSYQLCFSCSGTAVRNHGVDVGPCFVAARKNEQLLSRADVVQPAGP